MNGIREAEILVLEAARAWGRTSEGEDRLQLRALQQAVDLLEAEGAPQRAPVEGLGQALELVRQLQTKALLSPSKDYVASEWDALGEIVWRAVSK